MILGILSDTHSLNIPSQVIERFKTVDLIIHAGDVCDVKTLKLLGDLAPVKAVQGNMDELAVKKLLPVKEILACDKVRVGVTHGHIGENREAVKNAAALFKDDKIDIVVFGHSHHALKEQIGPTLYFNPGSPNDLVKAKFFSYGLITCVQGRFKAEVIKI